MLPLRFQRPGPLISKKKEKKKQLRLNKVSELIHSSTRHRDIDTAKVSVHFKEIVDTGEHSYDEVPNSDLVVSRTAHRNNSSHYFVDGKKSSYGEVTALLKAKGVDLDTGRFLILQGEVEQIALMKPKAATQHETGLLEYLEDVIGTDRYVESIESGAKELDELNDARASALARARAAARERDGAAGAAEQARAHLAKEREAASLRRCLAELDASRVSAGAEEAQAAIEGLVGAESVAKEAAKEAAEALVEARQKADGRAAEHARVSSTLDAARAAFADCERRDCSLREDLKHLRAAEKTAEEAAAAAEASKEKAEREALEAHAEAPLAAAEAEEASKELAAERESAEELRAASAAEAEERAKKLAEARDAGVPWESRLAEAKAASSVAAAALESLREARDEAARRATEVRQAVTDAERALRDAEAAAAASQGGVEAAVEGARAARERSSRAEAAVAEAATALRSSRSALTSKRDAALAARSTGATAAALRDAQSKGVIPGFRGRLGDLGVIGPRFDVAVSAACPALDNFVVDDTAAAQACVSLLRKGGHGVATFLILEKQRHLSRFVDEQPVAPENVPRLFDLIKPSSADLAPAFYYATRDAVVAADLEQATRISFGKVVDPRWRRAVTLSGELVNESGTMTGGGAKPRGGRMRLAGKGDDAAAAALASAATSSVTAQDIADAEAAVSSAEAALSRAKAEVSQALEGVAAADAAVEEARHAGPRAELERAAAAERAADAKAALSALVESTTSNPSSASSLEATIAGAEAAAADAARAVAEVTRGSFAARAAVAAAEDALGSVGGSALASKLAACKRLEEKVSAAGARGARASAKAAAARRAAAKAEEEHARATAEKAAASASLAETEDRARALEEEALEIMRSAQEAAAALEVASADSRATREIASAKQAAADAARLAEVEASEALRAAREGAEAALERYKRASEAAEESRAALAAADAVVEEAKIDDDEEEESSSSDEDEIDDGENGDGSKEGEGELSDDRERSASLDDEDTAPLRRQAPGRRRSPSDEKEKGKKKPAPPAPLTEEELAALDASHLSSQLQGLQQQLDAEVPDLAALAAHSRASKDAGRKARELEKVTQKRNDARMRHDALRKKRLDEFMSGFAAISSRLKEMYRLITLGGDAELELVDSLDPFAEGVVFSVRPPKKAWKNISNLSGGEKTLSSLALVFALHHFKPTPLYVMDEIDAALDFRNVSIVAHYIKERVTKGAQFVIISLRNDMFELADRLVGIYKTHDTTKCVAVDPRDYACAGAPLPLTASSGGANGVAPAAPGQAAAAANAVGGEMPRAAVA